MFETSRFEPGLTKAHMLAVIGSMLGVLQSNQRSKQIKAFALKAGFASLGDTLPKSFPPRGTSFGSAKSISNAMMGERNGGHIVVFDCYFSDEDKGSFSRTVVAGAGDVSAFGWAALGPDVETEQAGDWAIVFSLKRRLGLGEIEALISEFERNTSNRHAEANNRS